MLESPLVLQSAGSVFWTLCRERLNDLAKTIWEETR